MSLFSVFLIGIGLSMDACAVSFAKGICLRRQVKTYALKLGLASGFSGTDAADWLVGGNLF